MNKGILAAINGNLHQLTNKKITLGFDGFIDVIFKVIRAKDDRGTTSFFQSIHEFGNYIIEKGERNFSLELEEMTTKIGGNMPIMAHALAQFGTQQQHCIGSMGYPSVHPVFQQMPANCHLYSFANPGLTKALEFYGNKILLAEIGPLNSIEWNTIKKVVGLSEMRKLFSSTDLICMLNWSELDNSTAIWQGVLTEVLPSVPTAKRPLGFFDLADCSKRTPESIREAMKMIQSFNSYWNVILSLNLNEATLVNKVLSGCDDENDAEKIGASLYDRLRINGIIIHYSREALYWNTAGLHRQGSLYVSNPKISTGAGDNFNAGFCAGIMMGLSADHALILGHATAHLYMKSGKSPSMPELLELLEHQSDTTIPLSANR